MAKARRNARTQRARQMRRGGARAKGTCDFGKVRYADRLEALIALADTTRPAANAKRTEKRIYRCPKCRGWHLTSQDKK